jgi:ADP-heptose:LPS heptosyltransferase
MMGAATAGRRFLKEGNHAVDDPWSQYLYAIPFSRTSNGLHAADVYRRIAAVKEHRGGYSLVTTEGEKDRAKRFLAQKGLASTDRLMVFQPGAAFPSKRWPVEHYIELGRLLVGSGWRIVVTGGPSDKEIASSIEKGVGQDCFAVAGETNFRQSIALCELARGCVCGDTALMHAACALNVPTYALFGPTNPVETGPYGGGNWVFSSHCPERPCFKTNCDACGCMRSILPRAVFSCIETGNPGENPECDVFKTELEKDGDFSLQPIAGRPHPYVNAANAYFTLKAFEPGLPEPVLNAQEKDASIHETMLWLDCVETMKNSLRNFLLMRSSSFVGDFERGKRELSRFKGIGEFWTAVLNLRLNSVPLLNPLEGIERSIEVCHATLRQVGNAVKAAPDGEIRSGS